LTVIRRVFTTALSLAALAAVSALAPHALISQALISQALAQQVLAQQALAQQALAQSEMAALVAKPVALPDMALGSAKAAVTITEFASMSCPHCAAFEQNVFPMIRSKYIDSGKIRYVFREFPLDIKAAAASMVARCMAGDDAEKFFSAIDSMFKQQDRLMTDTQETLKRIGGQAGMSADAVEACVKNQATLDKLSADEQFANETLKVDATPSFFINGEMSKGAMSFEEMDEKIKTALKK
jgi:protein-disulfide isomerase